MILMRCFPIFIIAISNCFAFETTADEVEIDTKAGICILSGNAIAKYDEKIFKADKIIVYKKNSEKLPTKITASGHVSYSDGKNTISSQKCEGDKDSIIFSQDVIIEGADFGRIEADKATYNFKTKKIDLTSEKKVKLTLNKDIESKLKKKK